MKDRQPTPTLGTTLVDGRLFICRAGQSFSDHAMKVLVRESWWSSDQADLPGPYHLFWMQGGQRALQCSRNAVRWLHHSTGFDGESSRTTTRAARSPALP
jgi:hypothetical protein